MPLHVGRQFNVCVSCRHLILTDWCVFFIHRRYLPTEANRKVLTQVFQACPHCTVFVDIIGNKISNPAREFRLKDADAFKAGLEEFFKAAAKGKYLFQGELDLNWGSEIGFKQVKSATFMKIMELYRKGDLSAFGGDPTICESLVAPMFENYTLNVITNDAHFKD